MLLRALDRLLVRQLRFRRGITLLGAQAHLLDVLLIFQLELFVLILLIQLRLGDRTILLVLVALALVFELLDLQRGLGVHLLRRRRRRLVAFRLHLLDQVIDRAVERSAGAERRRGKLQQLAAKFRSLRLAAIICASCRQQAAQHLDELGA